MLYNEAKIGNVFTLFPEETIDMKDWKKELLTIPNLLSLFRLVLIPVYVVLYLNAATAADYAVAAVVLAVSCLTDMIDGKIARHFNMVSVVGKVLDPIADKATQFSLLICLVVEFPVLWALMILFILKESFQAIACYLAYRKGMMLKGALISGKICTTVLFLSLIIMVFFHERITPPVVHVITVIDGIFLLIAFVHYAFTFYRKTPMIQDIDR